MANFIKLIVVVAVVGIITVSALFVFDVVTAAETKDVLQKVLIVLGIVALGGVVIGVLSRSRS